MRIGLIRHFPVAEPLASGWMTSAELVAWKNRYDAAGIHIGSVDLGTNNWARCLSSDSARAYATAQAAYSGSIVVTPLLREADFAAFPTGTLSLPISAWKWVFRLAWLLAHSSQRAARDDFRARVKSAADLILSDTGDTLVFSHAGMMAYLSAELVRNCGFQGPKLRVAEHARLYLYEQERIATRKDRPAGRHDPADVCVPQSR